VRDLEAMILFDFSGHQIGDRKRSAFSFVLALAIVETKAN